MGNDALAAMSNRPKLPFEYFKQLFAQGGCNMLMTATRVLLLCQLCEHASEEWWALGGVGRCSGSQAPANSSCSVTVRQCDSVTCSADSWCDGGVTMTSCCR